MNNKFSIPTKNEEITYVVIIRIRHINKKIIFFIFRLGCLETCAILIFFIDKKMFF